MDFKNSPLYPLLLISYEQFRIHAEFINTIQAVDLVVCDEAHPKLQPQSMLCY